MQQWSMHKLSEKKEKKDITEIVLRKILETLAQVGTPSLFMLQHIVSPEYRIWT